MAAPRIHEAVDRPDDLAAWLTYRRGRAALHRHSISCRYSAPTEPADSCPDAAHAAAWTAGRGLGRPAAAPAAADRRRHRARRAAALDSAGLSAGPAAD